MNDNGSWTKSLTLLWYLRCFAFSTFYNSAKRFSWLIEAVPQRYSWRKVFHFLGYFEKYSRNLQENTHTQEWFQHSWPWTSNFKRTPPLPLSNKLWNNNPNVHVNERNQNKNESKSRHIQIDETFYCSIQPTNNAMVSLKDGFTIWHQSHKEDFLLIIY